ncbi:tryptophan synthase subunit beta [Mycoplasma sp. Mirounga ES2805-ORL]|uniref:tryptophan synthase subunit beta n=1 Tax=Mycoplasma sp. Mirounga ES2805-ORL TaxID=754514 RepID=UPI00197B8214|nr:tryptophan synthase subunit beta [Mycoplasma sp. Mirounga ES2805-ORL]QSF13421.1 tryptophan synthase subunit beta [Mycoplasma sp. Mirounga ES2805-ORL]
MLDKKVKEYLKKYPTKDGYFGEYGGIYLDDELTNIFSELADQYEAISNQEDFKKQLKELRRDFQGRPTGIYYCKNLSESIGKVRIHIKREDQNENGSHKTNHCMAEALFAKMIGKKKLIAETGAGSHGSSVAIAAAHFGLECEIHMGAVDIKKQKPNVDKMKILGAKIVEVTEGEQTLKEAVDSAFRAYKDQYKDALYSIGSVVGPHPFPKMVRDFQLVIGEESREQFTKRYNKLPDMVVACVGGGSNSIGSFIPYIGSTTKLVGVEPLGKGPKIGDNASTLAFGQVGVLHGFKSVILKDEKDSIAPVYSIAPGLDYPGVGPEHAFLRDNNLVEYTNINDKEAIEAFLLMCCREGIIPAIESSHALAYAIKYARENKEKEIDILVTLSGRGDKDLNYIFNEYQNEINEFNEKNISKIKK